MALEEGSEWLRGIYGKRLSCRWMLCRSYSNSEWIVIREGQGKLAQDGAGDPRPLSALPSSSQLQLPPPCAVQSPAPGVFSLCRGRLCQPDSPPCLILLADLTILKAFKALCHTLPSCFFMFLLSENSTGGFPEPDLVTGQTQHLADQVMEWARQEAGRAFRSSQQRCRQHGLASADMWITCIDVLS